MVTVVKVNDKASKYNYSVKTKSDVDDRTLRVKRSLTGIVSIRVKTNKLQECIDIIDDGYEGYEIQLEISEELVSLLKLYRPGSIANYMTKWEMITKHIEEIKMYIEQDAKLMLMKIVPNEYSQVVNELNQLNDEFKSLLITKQMVLNYYCLEDIIYPRQVFLAFMQHKRNRYNLLRKSVATFDTSLLLNSFRKYIKLTISEKQKYYVKLNKHTIYSNFDDNDISRMYYVLHKSVSIYQACRKFDKGVLC